jgi:hypothetical protein
MAASARTHVTRRQTELEHSMGTTCLPARRSKSARDGRRRAGPVRSSPLKVDARRVLEAALEERHLERTVMRQSRAASAGRAVLTPRSSGAWIPEPMDARTSPSTQRIGGGRRFVGVLALAASARR